MISLIACIAENGAIGFQNQLLYHIPEDMARFKALTMGHPIVMGRNTFESFPNGPLPGRRNIVVSRSMKKIDGCEVYSNLQDALEACKEDDLYIIGGASIYEQTIAMADCLHITKVDATPNEADTFFPTLGKEWKLKKDEFHPVDETHPFSYHFLYYIR